MSDVATRDRWAFSLPVPAEGTPIALKIPEDITVDEWAILLRKSSLVGSASNWWVGDALIKGEDFNDDHPDEVAAAIKAAQLDEQYIRHVKMVAACFGPLRRRNTLSWSHHREVVGFQDLAAQDLWLDRAEDGAWSKQQLREEICQSRLNGSSDSVSLVPFSLKTDEERVERWRHAALVAGLTDAKGQPDLRTWAMRVLDEAAA